MNSREPLFSDDTAAGFGSVEFVVLFPLLLVSLVALVQLALWGHMRTTATAAAQDAASLQAVRGRDEQIVRDTVASHGLTKLRSFDARTEVIVNGDIETFVVHIDGKFPAILSFIPLPIHATGVAPIEKFRP
jgi:TadE-like protein